MIPTLFGLGIYLTFWRDPRRLEGAAVSWGIGWGAVNLVTFVANPILSLPLGEPLYLVTSLVLGGAGAVLVARRWTRLRPLLRGPFLPEDLRHGFGLLSLAVLVGFLGFVFYKALIIYPVQADELIYHMELPKIAWQTGSLPLRSGIDLFDTATAYPDLLVTQQLWVYLGAGAFDPALVRVIPPLYTSLLTLLVFFDTRQRFGVVTAGLAATALLSLYSFTSLTILLMDEVPVAFFGYLAVRFAIEDLESGRAWYRAGLFAGLASLVKYDGLAALVALAIALLLTSRWRTAATAAQAARPTWADSARRVLGYLVVGIAPALPLLLRNAVRLGNPVYPYFFGGPNSAWSPALLAQVNLAAVYVEIWSSEAVSLLATVVIAALLLGLLRIRGWSQAERVFVLLVVFYLPPYLSTPLLGSQIRYLAPVLPAIAIFAGRQLDWWLRESPRPQRLASILIFLGLAGIGGALVLGAPFYSSFAQGIAAVIAEVFAVSAVLIAILVGAAWALRGGRAPRLLAIGVVLVLLVPGVVAVANEQWDPNPFGSGPNLLPRTQDAYLTMRLGSDRAMWKWMNANLPANASVLSFDPRGFYIDARLVSAISPEMMPTYNMTLPEALAYVRNAGIGYVLDDQFGASLFLNYLYLDRSPIFASLGNTTDFTVAHQEGSTILYAIRA